MVEPEVAFVLGEDLKGPGVNEASVMAATAGIVPALELVDMRYRNARFKATDAVAYNIFSAGLALGSRFSSPLGIDLRTLGLVLEVNGEVAETSAGASVMGNPALSLAWLANKLAQFDRQLYKGQVIITGSFTGAHPVNKGDIVRAQFSQIGEVSIKFS
jgi:2-keto-4-pentenoate hydratase